MDPQRWAAVRHDPVALLGDLGPDRLAELAADPDFVARVQRRRGRPGRLPARAALVPSTRPRPATPVRRARSPTSRAEFGITAVLPQYSGGLGILAGDHLKAASDLGVPIIGVGLLYKTGYFKQSLSREGWQQETYPVLDPDGLPLALLREADGTPCQVRVALPGGRAAGRARLEGAGRPGAAAAARLRRPGQRRGRPRHHRPAVRRLRRAPAAAGDAARHRRRARAAAVVAADRRAGAGRLPLQRGPRRLPRAGADPRARAVRAADASTRLWRRSGPARCSPPTPRCRPASTASAPTRSSTYFGGDSALPGVPVERILALGAEDYPGGESGVFNMAVMGLRLGGRANGVSQLHGEVSRHMFDGLWPGFDDREVPITSITNGVHAPDLGRPPGVRPGREVPRHPAGRRRERLGRRPAGAGRRGLGGPPRDARAAGARGAPAAALVLAASRRQRRRAGLDRRTCSTPTC